MRVTVENGGKLPVSADGLLSLLMSNRHPVLMTHFLSTGVT
jgi:hypothetical protein